MKDTSNDKVSHQRLGKGNQCALKQREQPSKDIYQMPPLYKEFSLIKDDNTRDRSSNLRCSVTKGVIRNFVKFTGKHLCQSLFFS